MQLTPQELAIHETAICAGEIFLRAPPKDKIKPISEEFVQITVTVRKSTFEKVKRAESLEAQKSKPTAMGDVLEACVETHLEKHDPVRKADRAKPQESTLFKQSRRASTSEIHKVNRRDRGRCTYVDENGERCNSDRWVEHHHVQPYAQGGGSYVENLTTLCSFHHSLMHPHKTSCPKPQSFEMNEL